MTKSKNKVLNYIILFVLVPMLLLSLFVALPKKNINSVYADYIEEEVRFNGSNLLVCATTLYSGTTETLWDFGTFSFDFYRENNVLKFRCYGGVLFRQDVNYIGEYFTFDNSYSITTDNASDYPVYLISSNGQTTATYLNIFCDSDGYSSFNCRVSSIRIYSSVISSKYYTHIVYTDNLGNSLNFAIYAYDPTGVAGTFAYADRTYYLTDPSSFTDNEIYNAGYNDGYYVGNSDGNSSGYTEGYSAGQSFGYQNGYNAGLDASGQYSFNSLIGAVIDAPISAFTSLLNFEILGFNILGFITGLLTLALIVFIIKLCLGGK